MKNNDGMNGLSWWTETGSQAFEKLSEQEAINNIYSVMMNRFSNIDIGVIQAAAKKALELHAGDSSTHSRRPVSKHILAVAKTIAEIGLDAEAVAAALLHDVIEDRKLAPEQIEAQFGSRICNMVVAVSRYDENGFKKTEASYQKDVFEKVIDTLRNNFDALPAVFIKLAEKLDHMRFSVPHLAYEQRQDIAHEIMEGYAPLAERLGVWKLKAELEDQAFRIINREAYNKIAGKHELQGQETEAFLRRAVPELEARLKQENIKAYVQMRQKHIYSTYEKMRRKGNRFRGVFDLIGLRIIVETQPQCYAALSIVHDMWKPVQLEFDDYIAAPKSNGYQSLHTTVVAKEGFALEVQIRTQKMHEVAEFGMAAHWRYKESGDFMDKGLSTLVDAWRKYLASQNALLDPSEFFRNFQEDILKEQIHVFYTATGELVSLPKYSTPIDLVYLIDEEKAALSVGAKIGEFEVPLDWQLHIGDRVTMLTADDHHFPQREWFTFVRTSQARSKISNFYKSEPREFNIREGEPILLKELNNLNLNIPLENVADMTGYGDPDELLANIGACNINARNVANEIFHRPYREDILKAWVRGPVQRSKSALPSRIILGECCRPEIGLPLVAVFDAAGLVIHRQECRNLHQKSYDPIIPLPVINEKEISIEVQIRIISKDRVGLIHDITNVFMDANVNIIRVAPQSDGEKKINDFRVEIPYPTHVANLVHRLRLVPFVEKVLCIELPGEKPYIWKTNSQAGPVDFKIPDVPITNEEPYSKQELREKILQAFSRDELTLLCADLDEVLRKNKQDIIVNPGLFGDLPLPNLVMELIYYLDRRGCLPQFYAILRKNRPNIFNDRR